MAKNQIDLAKINSWCNRIKFAKMYINDKDEINMNNHLKLRLFFIIMIKNIIIISDC